MQEVERQELERSEQYIPVSTLSLERINFIDKFWACVRESSDMNEQTKKVAIHLVKCGDLSGVARALLSQGFAHSTEGI